MLFGTDAKRGKDMTPGSATPGSPSLDPGIRRSKRGVESTSNQGLDPQFMDLCLGASFNHCASRTHSYERYPRRILRPFDFVMQTAQAVEGLGPQLGEALEPPRNTALFLLGCSVDVVDLASPLSIPHNSCIKPYITAWCAS